MSFKIQWIQFTMVVIFIIGYWFFLLVPDEGHGTIEFDYHGFFIHSCLIFRHFYFTLTLPYSFYFFN